MFPIKLHDLKKKKEKKSVKVNFILLKTQEQTTDQSSSLINFAIMILAIFQKSILQHHNTDILSSPSWRPINWRDSCINNSLKTFGHSHLVFIFFFCSLVEISRTHCISAALLQLCPLARFYILPLTEKQLQPKTHGISWIADLIEFTWKQQRLTSSTGCSRSGCLCLITAFSNWTRTLYQQEMSNFSQLFTQKATFSAPQWHQLTTVEIDERIQLCPKSNQKSKRLRNPQQHLHHTCLRNTWPGGVP